MKNKKLYDDGFIHMKKNFFQGKSDKKADKGLLKIQRGNQLQRCTRKLLNVGNALYLDCWWLHVYIAVQIKQYTKNK